MWSVTGWQRSPCRPAPGGWRWPPVLTRRFGRALLEIEQAGRGVLREVRWLVGVLRDRPEHRTMSDLAALADAGRTAGFAVALRMDGNLAAVPPQVVETAYRIVQEGLTNAFRYSGCEQVEVHVAAGDVLQVRVLDDGAGTPAADGHGIRGMRERATAVGGEVYAGPRRRRAGLAGPGRRCRFERNGDDHPGRRRRRPGHDPRRLPGAGALAPDLEFVGEASNGEQAVALARQQRSGRAADGRADAGAWTASRPPAASSPTRRPPAVRVIVLTTFDLDELRLCARCARGRAASCSRTPRRRSCCSAIRVVADGGALLAPAVTRRLIAEFAARPGAGTAAPRIAGPADRHARARCCGWSRGACPTPRSPSGWCSAALTAKTHVSRILTKLGLRDRAQLVVAAYEAGPASYPGR